MEISAILSALFGTAAIAAVTTVVGADSVPTAISQQTTQATAQAQSSEPITDASTDEPWRVSTPRRLKVTVQVADKNDLKILEGQDLTEGQVIADRERERSRLTSQKKAIELSLEKLKGAMISPPTLPRSVPAVTGIPPINFAEYEAGIEKTKATVSQIEQQIELKKSEISYLAEVPNLDSIILDHEQTALAELQQQHNAAIRRKHRVRATKCNQRLKPLWCIHCSH